MQVRELMTTPVITVTEDCPLEKAAEIMVTRRIGCLPIVNRSGEMTGIVTESDFSATEKGIPFSLCRFPQVLGEWLPQVGVERIYARARQTPVSEVMQHDVVTVDEGDTVELVLEKMLHKHVHRVPVMRGKMPVGIVARRDLMRLMLDRMSSRTVS